VWLSDELVVEKGSELDRMLRQIEAGAYWSPGADRPRGGSPTAGSVPDRARPNVGGGDRPRGRSDAARPGASTQPGRPKI
jgi:hypothetical protein